jgi:hypothetical protein
MKSLLRGALRAYQVIGRPLLGPRCRFYPSCSDYALEALQRHGSAATVLLTAKRLARCHPLSEGGLDPVPEKPSSFMKLWIPND